MTAILESVLTIACMAWFIVMVPLSCVLVEGKKRAGRL